MVIANGGVQAEKSSKPSTEAPSTSGLPTETGFVHFPLRRLTLDTPYGDSAGFSGMFARRDVESRAAQSLSRLKYKLWGLLLIPILQHVC